MRRFVALRTPACLVLIGLGLFCFLAFAHPASARDTLSPSADIRDYVVAKYALEDATDTVILLSFGGAWVKLKGPITISVVINDNGSVTREIVKIEAEETYTVGGINHDDFPPPWDAAITLVSIDISQGIDMLQFVFGADAKELGQYINQHALPADRASGDVAANDARDALLTWAASAGGRAALPNMAEAANEFAAITFLAAIKDKDTNKPLFPSLQSRGIRQVLMRMTINGAGNERSLAATKNLLSLLCGMDMANQSERPSS